MAYKACTKCAEVKPFTHFTINGNRRRAECRECERERAKLKKRECREKVRAEREQEAPPAPCLLASAFNRWGGVRTQIHAW